MTGACCSGFIGIDVTFVDYSTNNVERARQYGFDAFKMDLNDGLSNFAEKQFDGVVMIEVIEHIVAAEFILKEIVS